MNTNPKPKKRISLARREPKPFTIKVRKEPPPRNSVYRRRRDLKSLNCPICGRWIAWIPKNAIAYDWRCNGWVGRYSARLIGRTAARNFDRYYNGWAVKYGTGHMFTTRLIGRG